MSPSAAPPSPQEIHRKLSVHSVARSVKPPNVSVAPVSGTESDSDSILTPDILTPSHLASGHYAGTSSSNPPLSSIAERRSGSGEDSEEEEEEEGGWKAADIKGKPRNSVDESVIKSGYLWKKGERRKTWKKRWFVLRPAHLAYYKSSAEYQLLRLLELSDVHSCTQVALKKHTNSFGLVSPVRTFYLQAKTPGEVQEWVKAIEDARQTLMATSTQNSVSSPIPIPHARDRLASHPPPPVSPSPPSHLSHSQTITSSDSEDASPSNHRSPAPTSPNRPHFASSPSKSPGVVAQDPAKTILSGYLMKCGSKRRNWRKRWFILTGEKLVYTASHMDPKPHRQFPFAEILDALEYDLPANRQNPTLISTSVTSPPVMSPAEGDDSHAVHTFKIVTTKRTLLLCAPNEEDEIKWLGAVRALIARRSGAGVVPGDSKAATPSIDVSPTNTGITSGVVGIKSKVRRLSASGPSGTIPEVGV
ncbi:pleckstrin-like protein [Infundibulicybe gibba]|nr:pleckstrin-like protein [Infundibulicybe gibba]